MHADLDGRREMFEKGGNYYEALVPDYTDDGAHLNVRGSQLAASKLSLYLTDLEQ